MLHPSTRNIQGLMKITEEISNDIVNLIKFRGMLDPDIEYALPPVVVQDCVDMEISGVVPPEELVEEANLWIAEQRRLQERAIEINTLMNQAIDAEMEAHNGLPAWIQQPWVAIISMPWSHALGDAITEAEACLT